MALINVTCVSFFACSSSAKVYKTAVKVVVNTQMVTIVAKTLNIIADVINTGKLENTDGIVSNSDITDKTSSMQSMRDTYNSHTHTGNQGSPTSEPKQTM